MEKQTNKIIAKSQWDEKYLREALWMPFGSLCNLVGQAFQGKGIKPEELNDLAHKIFELASEFTEKTYSKIEKVEEEIEIPVKKDENK